jgi:uncharacterized protein (TIGR02444 family)
MPGQAEPAGELWRFSLAVHDAPGVASLCLELQDRWGADVNLALAVAWAGASGRGRLPVAWIARLDREIAPLRGDLVAPLRGARRRLKPLADSGRLAALGALRARLKDLELEAECCVQAILEAALAGLEIREPPPARPDSARANVAAYLRHLGAPADGAGLGAAVEAWIRSR